MSGYAFIGREDERKRLDGLLDKKAASMVVVKGRRRIGKSRLIDEFIAKHRSVKFVGLAPVDGINAQVQRDEFARLLSEQTDLPELQFNNWAKLFASLATQTKTERIIIVLDEITWMAADDPTFLPKLKNAWELYFSKNPKLILILCGSVSAWIEKNILSSTGYFGRISKKITLNELPLNHCNDLLNTIGFRRSSLEKYMILSVTGGIPWYIEQINPKYSACDNIKELCFSHDGLLVGEYQNIFHDLFGRRSEIYSKITRFLASGPAEYEAIALGVRYPSSGTLSNYLHELVLSGYVKCDFSWSLKSGKQRTIALYRLADNYLRFYYKYIEPKLPLILAGKLEQVDLFAMTGWDSIIGLQFENLVLNNRNLILTALDINPINIVADNPYYQRQTKSQHGCQVDYLIHTRLNTLFVCEIKFSRHPINKSVITEMQNKIDKLVYPKRMTCVPVLIHVSGVTDELLDADYFYRIIDFNEYL